MNQVFIFLVIFCVTLLRFAAIDTASVEIFHMAMTVFDVRIPFWVHNEQFTFKADTARFFVHTYIASETPTGFCCPWITLHLVDIEHRVHWFAADGLRMQFLTSEVVEDITHRASNKNAVSLENRVVRFAHTNIDCFLRHKETFKGARYTLKCHLSLIRI